MVSEIRFEAVLAATREASEAAQLVWVDRRLAALLLPADDGWFLELGLGCCEAEGLIFATLTAVEDWVRSCQPQA